MRKDEILLLKEFKFLANGDENPNRNFKWFSINLA